VTKTRPARTKLLTLLLVAGFLGQGLGLYFDACCRVEGSPGEAAEATMAQACCDRGDEASAGAAEAPLQRRFAEPLSHCAALPEAKLTTACPPARPRPSPHPLLSHSDRPLYLRMGCLLC